MFGQKRESFVIFPGNHSNQSILPSSIIAAKFLAHNRWGSWAGVTWRLHSFLFMFPNLRLNHNYFWKGGKTQFWLLLVKQLCIKNCINHDELLQVWNQVIYKKYWGSAYFRVILDFSQTEHFPRVAVRQSLRIYYIVKWVQQLSWSGSTYGLQSIVFYKS